MCSWVHNLPTVRDVGVAGVGAENNSCCLVPAGRCLSPIIHWSASDFRNAELTILSLTGHHTDCHGQLKRVTWAGFRVRLCGGAKNAKVPGTICGLQVISELQVWVRSPMSTQSRHVSNPRNRNQFLNMRGETGLKAVVMKSRRARNRNILLMRVPGVVNFPLMSGTKGSESPVMVSLPSVVQKLR